MRFVMVLLAGLWLGTFEASAQALQSGDSLNISVLQDPKLDRTVLIDPRGEIAFPLAGRIMARGLTAAGVESILKTRLADKYKEGLDVTVAVAALTPTRSATDDDVKPKVFLTGEVAKPGSYTVRQQTTIMQAIALAGGLGPFAAKQRITIRRKLGPNNEVIIPFDYRLYEAGIENGNVALRPGDVILVPERGLFE